MDYCVEIFTYKSGIHINPNKYCEKCELKFKMRDDCEMGKHMENVHRNFKCDFGFSLNCECVGESNHA